MGRRRFPLNSALLPRGLALSDKQPSPQQVDALHAQLLQAIETLFDTHKHALGWGHKTIRFV